MTTAEKLLRHKSDLDNVYNAGYEKGKAESEGGGSDNYRKELWDKITQNGTITNCEYLFAGKAWTDDTFDLEYVLQPTKADGMFYRSGISDFTNNPVDFSQCATAISLYEASDVVRIGTVDLSNVTVRTYYGKAFYNCKQLVWIDKVIFNYNTAIDSSIFGFSPNLSHVMVEGTIYQSFTINASTLDLESAKSVLLALENYAGTTNEFKYKITLSEGTWAVLAADGNSAPHGGTWVDYAQSLGWNV